MKLSQALRLTNQSQVALVGSGGKTTALFQLARQMTPPVVLTASTHMGVWQAELADHHLVVERPEDIERSTGQIEGVTLITGPEGEDNRLGGLNEETLFALHELALRLGFPLLIEADGSRQKALKAPAAHEPVIPDWVEMVVVVAGLSALGKPLDDETVFRSTRFADLSGAHMGDLITPDQLARVLNHPEGGSKGIPKAARRVVLLNQIDQEDLIQGGLRIANKVLGSFDAAVLSSLENQTLWRVVEPTGGVILSGGGSSRYGQPKMMLPWRGYPLIRHVTETALAAGLKPVIVVLGAVDQPIRGALEGLPVVIVDNPDWQSGQSASVRKGLASIPANDGAALFLLADQPLVTSDLLATLIEQHQKTLAPVIAPRVEGRRANPVLFDRITFPALMGLEGDTGGRAIFDQFPPQYLEWPDKNLLLDIDTPEDYERLRGLE